MSIKELVNLAECLFQDFGNYTVTNRKINAINITLMQNIIIITLIKSSILLCFSY